MQPSARPLGLKEQEDASSSAGAALRQAGRRAWSWPAMLSLWLNRLLTNRRESPPPPTHRGPDRPQVGPQLSAHLLAGAEPQDPAGMLGSHQKTQ